MERYERQTIFAPLGKEGQARLLESRVLLCGCGALGTNLANSLVRAGVGMLRIVDRDFIEFNNLQRQILFDEQDIADNLPKAEAAARKLRLINSSVQVEAVVADIDHTNIGELARGMDLLLDGTDNFETRYLINEASIKLGIPWIYAGVIGSHGMTMNILPGETRCLRCIFEEAPPPGLTPSCDTAGVLGPAVAAIVAFQAAEALKLLAGKREALRRTLLMLDVWENEVHQLKIPPPNAQSRCPVCQERAFDALEGKLGSHTVSLCGRNAVQIVHRSPTPISFELIEKQLAAVGSVSFNRFMLRCEMKDHQITLFPDGRAIIKGTSDVNVARSLYARYIGA